MTSPHMFDSFDEVPDALKAEQKGLHAWLSVTFLSDESAEHSDSSDDLEDSGRRSRDGLLGEDVSASPLFVGEKAHCPGGRKRSPQSNQSCQSSQGVQIDGRCRFSLAGATELQSFDSAAGKQRAKTGYVLPVDVQFSRVLEAKSTRMSPNSGFASGNVADEYSLAAQVRLLTAGLIEESISGLRLRPIWKGPRTAGRRLFGKPCRHFDRPTRQTTAPQYRAGKIFRSPSAHHHLFVKMTLESERYTRLLGRAEKCCRLSQRQFTQFQLCNGAR